MFVCLGGCSHCKVTKSIKGRHHIAINSTAALFCLPQTDWLWCGDSLLCFLVIGWKLGIRCVSIPLTLYNDVYSQWSILASENGQSKWGTSYQFVTFPGSWNAQTSIWKSSFWPSNRKQFQWDIPIPIPISFYFFSCVKAEANAASCP